MSKLFGLFLQNVNFDFEVCSVIILIVIAGSMLLRKATKGVSNRLYFHVVLATLLACISDAVSEISLLPVYIRLAGDYIYFISTLFIPILYMLYVYKNVGILYQLKKSSFRKIMLVLPSAIGVAVLILNFIVTIFCDLDTLSKWFWAFRIKDGYYERGYLQRVLILCCLSYLVNGFFLLLKKHKLIPKQRMWPLMAMIPSIILGLTIQQFFQGFEMTLFGLTIGVLIISFTIQRSDEDINEVMGIKNENCFHEELRKYFSTKQKITILYIKVYKISKFRRSRGIEAYNRILQAIAKTIEQQINNFTHSEIKKNRFFNFFEFYSLKDGNYAITIETSNVELAKKLAGNITDCLKDELEVTGIKISLASKICIVQLPKDFETATELINFQDKFDRKVPDGLDSVVVYSDFCGDKNFIIKNNLDDIIVKAINERKFEMYYQPIYSVKTKKFESAEALIRLNDSRYGFVSPALFIPAAESSGAIHAIGDYVIDEVCRFASTLDLKKTGFKYIEFNLSAAQCIENDLPKKIKDAVKKYNITPDDVNLEITESAADKMTRDNIVALHNEGYTFSIDDYGVGQSNFQRLFDLPFEIIKFDKLFADNINDYYGKITNESLIEMFKKMNKKIVVEGIEDEETLDYFASLGCDYIQGYVFSKPLNSSDFIKFIQENNR